ncbi:MAG TPA: ATP-dependent helicase HrpB [Gemmatimonadaceae bacterium]|jgi:ATP-dependent helicase HrpB|nr:ATP-dependent helicase HrpB [Gemmatimonadaceae bacterium]
MARLPVDLILPEIVRALESHRSLVIQAPPGAGKTTRVPPALLGANWLDRRIVLMLEPRRLATRSAASFMAAMRGESVGGTVGYRMRGESRVGPKTRIEVVTEGVLVRRIQRDPTLDDVGAILFDEFHERNLDADVSLALALRTRALVRDDLRLIAMSATLDGEAVARILGGARIVTSVGRAFPVDTRYITPRADARLEATVGAAVKTALRTDSGDVLVFLPGGAEIRRAAALLGAMALDGVVVLPLLGALSHDEQDRALRPDPHARRKIVLATSIAETSLTIDGVGVVIDSGLARLPRFSPRTGMTRLDTIRVSLASADQRRGRAGRLGPGVCYRLWPEHETLHLTTVASPEIANADLTPLALTLAAAGVSDPTELSWLDSPPPAPFAQARELLRELGAIDASHALTPAGAAMSELPVHPRLARMLLRAKQLRATEPHAASLAAELAALIGERDVLRSTAGSAIDPDIALRLDALRRDTTGATAAKLEIDHDAVRGARAEADRLARQMDAGADRASADPQLAGVLLALAYPDRIGQRRSGTQSRYVLRNGRGAEISASAAGGLATAPFIVAAELDDRRPESRIFLAAAITLEEIRGEFADQITTVDTIEFDESTSTVRARRRDRLGALVLRDVAIVDPDPAAILRLLIEAIARRGIAALPWSESANRYRARLAFAAYHDSAWPRMSDRALEERLDEWLAPALDGARSFDDLARVDLTVALDNLIDRRQRRDLDTLAPTHLVVPSGSRVAVDYSEPSAPVLAVRIQEVFGWTQSPRLMDGRVAVTMHLLSPAHRPVQVTRDLRSFWQTSYFDVRKDLRGRYPKHAWPEDPLAAAPTRRAKPRS